MPSILPAAVAAVCTFVTLPARAAQLPAPFRNLSFEAAQAAAAREKKLVFVDFYTTWCEPCKRLDAETFSDATVAALIGETAVAIKLDAEKEGKPVAQRYKVSAYPTLLLVKPDGKEVDRLIGFSDPRGFQTAFKKIAALAAAGTTGLEEARKRVPARSELSESASGDPEDAQPRFELARKLIISGNHEEALKELLWCWDEGKKDPEFARTRSTTVTRELGRLARDYPPARAAMLARRDQARERAVANKGGSFVIQDLIQLNRELKTDDDTIAVFDQLPEGDRRKVTISIYLFDVFLEKQRYADAMLFNMPESFTMNIERTKAQMKSGKAPSPPVQFTVTSTAKRVEAMAGAGLLDQARELAEKLYELDSSADTKALLNRHVARAGKPDLFAGTKLDPKQ